MFRNFLILLIVALLPSLPAEAKKRSANTVKKEKLADSWLSTNLSGLK